ncbi:MAG: VOC family protein [Candidatus Bathyarchaeota archaeon]|nr:VOC family protein [Candidatus Termiticorpusculum sp.]
MSFLLQGTTINELEILDCYRMNQRFTCSTNTSFNKISAFIFSRENWTGIYYASAMGTVQLFVWKNDVKVANSDPIDLKSVRYGNDPIPISEFQLNDSVTVQSGDVIIFDFVFEIGYLGAYLRVNTIPVANAKTEGFSSIGGLLVQTTINGDTVSNLILALYFDNVMTAPAIPAEQIPPPAPSENIVTPNGNETGQSLVDSLFSPMGVTSGGNAALIVGGLFVTGGVLLSGIIIYRMRQRRRK